MVEIKRYFAAPNLWCVWDKENKVALFVNLCKGACENWVNKRLKKLKENRCKIQKKKRLAEERK